MQPNQYSPPKSDVSGNKPKISLSIIAAGLLAISALQMVWFAFWAPVLWELVRTGAINLIYFLLSGVGFLTLLIGALQFAAKSSSSIYFFAAASAFSMLALVQHPLPIGLSCAVLSISLFASSVHHFKSPRHPKPGV